MPIVKEVEMDAEGHVILGPEVREILRGRWPEENRKKLKMRCIAYDEVIILTLVEVPTKPGKKEQDFFDTPLGKYVLCHTNPDVTLEDVLKATSGIKGTLAAEVVAGREEQL